MERISELNLNGTVSRYEVNTRTITTLDVRSADRVLDIDEPFIKNWMKRYRKKPVL